MEKRKIQKKRMGVLDMKNKKGITLIALIITVIVLLILAGVSISLVVGDNGVISQAQESKIRTETASAQEAVDMALGAMTAEFMGDEWPNDTSKKIGEWATTGKLKEEMKNNGYEIKVNGAEVANNAATALKNGDEITVYKSGTDNTYEYTLGITDTALKIKNEDEVTAQWTFATGGDIDSSGTLTEGDLVQPTNTDLSNEKFYVIEKDSTTVTLLAEKCVKTSSGEGQYTQMDNAGTLAFDSDPNVYYTDSTHYASIKGHVDAYASRLETAGLTLENVEVSEDPNVTATAKARLMWGTANGSWNNDYTVWTYTSGTGEIRTLLGSNLTNKNDIVYGPSGTKLNYWLGSPNEDGGICAWLVSGRSEDVSRGDVNDVYGYGLRPVIKVLQSNF